MGVIDSRLRLLYVMKILFEETNQEHYMNQKQIISKLQEYENELGDYKLTVDDRRSIYNDIEALTRFGIDIEKAPSNRGWYVNSHLLEDSEIKLLIDAIRGARFISDNKTNELTKKLESFTNKWSAKALHKNTISIEQKDFSNRAVFYAIDTIQTAIHDNKQIVFRYIEWTEKKEERFKKNGEPYVVSPWSLIWNNEYYYMLAHDNVSNGIKHYRLDRIREINLTDKKREGCDVYNKYQSSFTQKTFGMFGGKDVSVSLRCKNDMAGVIIDRFGKGHTFVPDGENYFIVNVEITSSPQFYGWLASMADSIKIRYPKTIQEDYLTYLKYITDAYKE